MVRIDSMGLNKQSGNMYPWVDYTINFIKGKCPHECSYCYMHNNPSWKNPYWFDEKEFEIDLGSCNTIFIGSSIDHFAEKIPWMWIHQFLISFLNPQLSNQLFFLLQFFHD